MNRDKISNIASSLLFKVSDEVLADFDQFFTEHLENLHKLKSIDTEGVEPMFFVDQSPRTFLREDIIGNVLPKELLLANSMATIDDFVILPKAVKNEK